MDSKSIRLTQTVKKGGCAAKLPAGQLRQVLKELKFFRAPDLKVGAETLDDAALWDLKDGRYLVQTLDFFTPIVDDARDFGAIAAANAVSDIYAMGGDPITALTILAFPSTELPLELIGELMKGAGEVLAQSKVSLAGGHTIDDDTIKFGFSVSGLVDRDHAWTNAGAKVGDTLILTKALGTGTITTALKLGEAPEDTARAAILSMKQLNQVKDLIDPASDTASDTANDTAIIHAATDITGFGLAGHTLQMAQASNVQFEISTSALPLLPGALSLIENEYLNRAHHTNREYSKPYVEFSPEVTSALQWMCVDPQTSGGLLLSVPTEHASALVARLQTRFTETRVIGKVVAGSGPIAVRFGV